MLNVKALLLGLRSQVALWMASCGVVVVVLFATVAVAKSQFLSGSTTLSKRRQELRKGLRNNTGDFNLLLLDSTSFGQIESYDSGFFVVSKSWQKISVNDPALLGLEENGNYGAKGAVTGFECGVAVALFEVLSHLHGDSGGYPPLVGGLFSLIFYGLPLTGLGALIGSAFGNNTFYPISLLR